MNRTNEIILLTNPGFHTMEHNGYIENYMIHDKLKIGDFMCEDVIFIKFNKEYFN